MKNRRISVKEFLTYILVASTISYTSCKEEKKQVSIKTKITFKKEGILSIYRSASDSLIKTLDIEIADNDYETQTGLMYRNSIEANQGMLFIFEDSRPRSFYMKNTHISLDLIYIDENRKIVSTQLNAKPMDETSLPSNANAKYVLEINAGLFDKWNLKVGDSISYIKD